MSILKKYLFIQILLLPVILMAQQRDIVSRSYIDDYQLKKVMRKEKIDYDKTFQVPIFNLDSVKTINYECYKDLTPYINFDEPTKVMVLFFKDDRVIKGAYEGVYEVIFYDIVNEKIDDRAFLSIGEIDTLRIKYSNFFIVNDFYYGFWTFKDNKTYKISYKRKNNGLTNIRAIPSGEYIAKEYGAEYIRSLVNDSIYLGIVRPLCD